MSDAMREDELAALREALEICVTELRRRERAAGKVIASAAAIFARSRLEGLNTTLEIEAEARAALREDKA